MKTAKELELSLLLKESHIQQLNLKVNNLEDRINKAIEMLEEWTIFETSACTDRIISETLDILKGVDKE